MSLLKTKFFLRRSIHSSVLSVAFFALLFSPSNSSAMFFQQFSENAQSSQTNPRATRTYRVKPGDTKFSLARAFDVSIEKMENENPQIKNQLLAGQIITVSNAMDPATMYVVAAGDTKFSLAKDNGVSVEALEAANPHIRRMLKTGQVLHIPNSNQGTYLTTTESSSVPKTSNKETEIVVKPSNSDGYDLYTVQPDDTLWGLSQKSGMTVPEFLKLNPHVTENLMSGTTVKIPSNSIKATAIVGSSSGYSNLLANAIKSKKINFALLTDSENTNKGDFIKGAQMAIDSLNKLGLNTNLKLHSANEISTNSSNFTGIIIPFSSSSSETESLKNITVPVFARFNDYDSNNKNWIKVQPNSDDTKTEMLKYIKGKAANVIIVSDPKQTSDIQVVESVITSPSIIKTEESGMFEKGHLINKLEKGKNNIILIDSSDPNVFLGVTNTLLTKLNEYQLQLAVLDSGYIPDETLVSTKRYRILQMMYPSNTPVVVTNSEAKFLKSYSKRYGQQATEDAITGFDVTFDSALRLAQTEELTKTFDNSITRQFNLKFHYKPSSNGYENHGIYLYQYDPEVGIKEIR